MTWTLLVIQLSNDKGDGSLPFQPHRVAASCIESCNISQRHLTAETAAIVSSDCHVHF
jgi:hypothetical protein